MSAGGLSTDELRAAVRAVLRDVLTPDLLQGLGSAAAPALEQVAVRDDAELDALVRRVAALCEDPTRRAAMADGRHGFRLAGGAAPSRQPRGAAHHTAKGGSTGQVPVHGASGVVRVERGAVTERTVVKAAADGARLVVGPKAVLTPLARDKARVLGVEIEKER
jgi:hypothetical protein